MALNANELMIGNWIESYGKVVKLSSVSTHLSLPNLSFFETGDERRHSTFIKDGNVKGIPLTPEILKKAGYKFVWEADGYLNLQHLIYQYADGSFSLAPFCTTDKDCLISINYVHQLQNLTFALTGHPLDINL